MSNNITHEGVVIKTEGTLVTVRFVQSSACSGCHAKGICSSQDSAEKIVVAESYGVPYQTGEAVNILVSNRMAWQAVLFAFAIPLVLALAMLFGMVSLFGELTGCLATLGVLFFYYVGLYLLRHRLGSKVEFTLERKV